MVKAGGFPGYYESECAAQAGSFQGLLGHGQIPLSVGVAYSIANSPQQAAPIPPTVHWLCEFENHDIIALTLTTSPETTKQPDGLDVPDAGSSTARACSAWVGVEYVRSDGCILSFYPPPGIPILFCTHCIGPCLKSETVSESSLVGSFALEYAVALSKL